MWSVAQEWMKKKKKLRIRTTLMGTVQRSTQTARWLGEESRTSNMTFSRIRNRFNMLPQTFGMTAFVPLNKWKLNAQKGCRVCAGHKMCMLSILDKISASGWMWSHARGKNLCFVSKINIFPFADDLHLDGRNWQVYTLQSLAPLVFNIKTWKNLMNLLLKKTVNLHWNYSIFPW